MTTYSFILMPWTAENRWAVNDALNYTLELSVLGTSFKDALRQLYKALEFDKYIHAYNTVWVYWKSRINGKLFLVPAYEDVDIQASP